jgi:hypothetical protein
VLSVESVVELGDDLDGDAVKSTTSRSPAASSLAS